MNGYSRDRRAQERKKFEGFKKPRGEKKWSHQRELESLIGKKLYVHAREGILLYGVLTAADQFTLQITFDDDSSVTLYKSSLTFYTTYPVPPEMIRV